MIAHFEYRGWQATRLAEHWFDLVQEHAFRAVIFDCDGTLVDSSEAHFQAFRRATDDQGYCLERDWYLERTGLDRRSLFRAFCDHDAPNLNIERAVDDSIAHFASEVWRIAAITQTVELLKALFNSGMSLAVGTNSESAIALQSLGTIGILDMVPVIACVSNTNAPKPAPDIFLAAAKGLHIPAREILVIEDSREGVLAAKAAGMAVLQIAHGGDAP